MPDQPAAQGPGDVPTLVISRCREDGTLAYPADERGCQVCGAFGEQIELLDVRCEGEVLDAVTVHRHRGWPEAPFRIAAIALDGGPVVRALLRDGHAGSRVRGERVLDAEDSPRVVFAALEQGELV